MDPEMLTFYLGGIRVLLLDNDSKFLKTASMLLSLLNFKVSTCRSPRSALNALSATGDKFKEVDVVLADANKVTTSGFDFKGIVEPELRVPVFYFLSQNHSCASAEADALLRTLDLASFILKKPFEVEDACSLWRDVAWRKCALRSKTAAATAGDVGQGRPPQWPRSPDDDGEEKERVHFRIVIGGGKKRKDRPGNSSGSSIAAPARRRGRPRKNPEQATAGVAGKETDCLAKPTPRKLRSKKARENGASASMPQIPEAMDVQPELPPQQKQSLFVHSVLQTLDVPPYNPSIFADAVEPGSNIISFSSARNSTNRSSSSSSSSSTTTPVFSEPAPTPPPVYQAPPPPASPRVNQAPAPAAAVYPPPPPALPVQQTPASNIAPPVAATADEKDALLQLLRGAFGPFPYQGPRPAKQQDMFAPGTFGTSNSIQPLSFQQPPAATGDPFTGMAGGAATGGAAGATHAGGDYGNTASTLMQSLQLSASTQDGDHDIAGLLTSYNAADPHLMVPQQQEVEDVATLFYSNNNAAMYNNSNNGESSVALHQGHGTAYGVNDPALPGGAFDGNAAAFTAPQGSGIVNNQLTTMVVDDLEAMFASDGNEGDYHFPLEYLMGTDLQMFDVGLGSQQGGEGTVGAADAFLNGGEGGMENWAVGSAHDIPMLEGMLMNNTTGGDLFQYYMNIGPE